MGDLLAVLALLLFAGNAFVVRAAAAHMGQRTGFLVALVANVVVGAVLVVGHLAVRAEPLRVDPFALGMFAVSGIFASYLGRRGYFRTVETIGPSRASTIQNSSPAFALVLGWLLLGERLGPVELACMGGVMLGLYLASGRLAGGTVPWREIGVGLFSAAAYAVGNIIRGDALDRWSEPLLGALAGAVAATVVYAALHRPAWSAVAGPRRPRRGLALWLLSGALTIGGQACVIASTAYLPVSVAVAISAATPMVVIPVSVLLFANRERVRPRTAVGAVLIAGGVAGLLLV